MLPQWIVIGAKFLANLCLIFGPAVPYLLQYSETLRSRSTQGFSSAICALIIFSNVLRISYWVARPFDNALCLQSVVMILAMILLLDVHIIVCRENEVPGWDQTLNFYSLNPKNFWEWTDILSYVQAIVCIQLLGIFTVLFFGWVPGLVTTIGFVSVFLEVLSIVPLSLQIFFSKSVRGISKGMVLLWQIGDLFRLGFLCLSKSPLPMPFLISTVFSCFIDVVILIQVFLYENDGAALNED